MVINIVCTVALYLTVRYASHSVCTICDKVQQQQQLNYNCSLVALLLYHIVVNKGHTHYYASACEHNVKSKWLTECDNQLIVQINKSQNKQKEWFYIHKCDNRLTRFYSLLKIRIMDLPCHLNFANEVINFEPADILKNKTLSVYW